MKMTIGYQVALPKVQDSGPIYAETIMGRIPVEPFNTTSNLVFLAVIIFFAIKIWRSGQRHYFIAAVLPIFFVGFIGGTLYHATRSSEIWLLLDWVPIVVLCLACSIYFVFKYASAWWLRLVILAAILVLNLLPRILPIPVGYATSAGYVGTAVAVLLPIFLYLYKTSWKYLPLVLAALLSFAAAVTFRTLDKKFEIDWLWMGTHWLWHTLGGIAVFWLMLYIYKDIERRSTLSKHIKH
jgi:hemolysin III